MSHWYNHWLWPSLSLLNTVRLIFDDVWTPRFPRAFYGRRVSIAANGCVYPVRMRQLRKAQFWAHSPKALSDWGHDAHVFIRFPTPDYNFWYRDEGVTWCFGWEGPDVDALRVTSALRPPK